MSSVDSKVIRSLLEEVERLESVLTTGAADMTTARINEKAINEIRAAIMGGPIFDASRWSQLTEDKQKDLLDRLTMIRDAYVAKNNVEIVRQSNYLLQGEGRTTQSIIWVAVFGSIFAATLFSLIR